jgi:hypothetical protein
MATESVERRSVQSSSEMLAFWVEGFGLRVRGSGFRAQGSGCRVES